MSNDESLQLAGEKGQKAIIRGMILSVVLGLVKLVAGLVGHSYVLVADAIESFTDLISAVVVLGGLHVSTKPATERFPYGYGKAESLAAVTVAAMICIAGFGIGVKAIHEILTPHHAPAPFTLGVLVVVILVKEVLFRSNKKTAESLGSNAVEADAWHHRADAITSALAFFGISIALLGGPGWEPADDYAALLAAGIIAWNGWKLAEVPIKELLDVQSPSIALRAKAVAESVPGVVRVQKSFSRKSGMMYWVDMHLWVPPEMNVKDAHKLSHAVKDSVRAQIPEVQDVLIHLEPAEEQPIS